MLTYNVYPCIGGIDMRKDIIWLPGALITFGGLFTFIYMLIEIDNAQKQAENAEYVFEKFLSSLLVMSSGALIFPMIVGLITGMIGLIMTRKYIIGLAFVTILLSMMMFHWIGFLASFGGSILAFVIFPKSSDQTT